MMDQNDAAAAKHEPQEVEGFEDSQKVKGYQQGHLMTFTSDGSGEPSTYMFLDEASEGSGKRKRPWVETRRYTTENIAEHTENTEAKSPGTNNEKERKIEPTMDVRHNESQLQNMILKSSTGNKDDKMADDSRRFMVAKAQHEVTSLSPTERNRILESIHGIVDEKEVGHGRNEAAEFSSKSFSAILPLSEFVETHDQVQKMNEEDNESRYSDTQHPRLEDKQERSVRRDSVHEQRFIQGKLEEFDEALRQIKQKVAYNQAIEDLVEYVEDPKFRLIFLRADSYDARKAAQRLVSFLDEKLKRFGPEALTRQLTIDDLSGNAKSLFAKKGVFQVLPTRDSSDRAILVAYYHAANLRVELRQDPSSLGDAIFYLLSAMAEDEVTQRRGLVTLCVISATPQPEKKDVDVILHSALEDISTTIYNWCPLKCNAHHHWIYDDNTVVAQLEGKHHAAVPMGPNLPGPGNTAPTTMSTILRSGEAVFDTISACFGKDYRIRTRLHEGSFEDYKGILKTFGIPSEQLPFSIDGSEIRVSGSHGKWLQRRRQKEAMLILHRQSMLRDRELKISMDMEQDQQQHEIVPSCFDVIDIPGRHDVCLGRGTTLHQHAGNIAMRAMMEPLVDEYENATSTRRQDLNKVIIQAVHLIGGKFLTNKSNDGAWFEVVTDMAVVEKSIGGIFRSMVSRVNANKKSSWTLPGSST